MHRGVSAAVLGASAGKLASGSVAALGASAEGVVGLGEDSVAAMSAAALAVQNVVAWGLHDRLRQVRFYALVAALVGLGCAIASAYQIFWACFDPANGQDPTCLGRSPTTDALKAACSASTGVLLALIVARTYLEFGELKERGQLTEHETFLNSPQMPFLLIELAVCGAHCPAGVYGNSAFQARGTRYLYDLDSLFSVWMLTRLYLVVQMLRDAAGFSGLIARVIGRFNTVQLNSTFAFRSILREHPLSSVVAFFGITMVVEGYALHVFERPVCATDFALKAYWCADTSMGLKDFSDLSVSIWNAVITSLTIGYGDVYPVTHPGRIVSVISGLVGAVTTALLINSVAEFVRLPPDSEHGRRAVKVALLERKRRGAALLVVRCFMAHSPGPTPHSSFGATTSRTGPAAPGRLSSTVCVALLAPTTPRTTPSRPVTTRALPEPEKAGAPFLVAANVPFAKEGRPA